MKTLLIDVNYRFSSTGEIVEKLRRTLTENGHEAYVAYGRGDASADAGVYKFGIDGETVLHALLTRLTGWTGRFSPLSTRRLIALIEREKPDVVHLHELHAYFVNVKPLLRRLAALRVPVVQTLHCEFTYTGKCGHAMGCERWKAACGQCPRLREYPATWLFDHTRSMLRDKKTSFQAIENLTVVAPSQWLADRARQSFLAGRPIHVVPNGLDTDVFRPRDASALRERLGVGDAPVLLAVAPDWSDPHKGLAHLLDLAKRLPDCKLVLVGANPPPSESNVIGVGVVPHDETLAKFYSLADAFVLTSRLETYSMTCAEALCCGARVVGFRAGAPETVFPPEHATFVPYGDVDALSRAVRGVLAEERDRAEIAKAASALYGWREMGARYLAIYEGALARERR